MDFPNGGFDFSTHYAINCVLSAYETYLDGTRMKCRYVPFRQKYLSSK